MKVYIEPIGRLINEFSKLPGVGQKTAQRFAYKVVNMNETDAKAFADAIINVKKNVHYCKICGNFSEGDICDVCKNRSSNSICVVKEPKDVTAMEKLKDFKGVYHVLHGVISPVNGITPDKLKIKELLARIDDNVKEIIVATNPTVEGEATLTHRLEILTQARNNLLEMQESVARSLKLVEFFIEGTRSAVDAMKSGEDPDAAFPLITRAGIANLPTMMADGKLAPDLPSLIASLNK